MSSESAYPRSACGRPWNRHKYFGHHIGSWSEAHPKRLPADGWGFNGVAKDFSQSWIEWRKNYDHIYSAGGPHSILGDTKMRPPKPAVGQRTSGLVEQVKLPESVGGPFHTRKRCSSGFLVPPDPEDVELRGIDKSAPRQIGTPAERAMSAPVQRIFHRVVISKSHQKLWYDGGRPDREFTGATTHGHMPGITSNGFRRQQHTSTSVKEIQF